MAKRVYCLYRVSTTKQVEKNDIPMQKQDCREFIDQHPDWELTKEFYEKGISGFKVSAKDRDAIQEIQKDATMGCFDILLVFMFDRLGRKEDETPFIVEWFVRNGTEVWSAKEGQQRFDNHVDKLMNYIRYWQASGESIKTSVRTKTRLAQIVQEGRFRGGVAAYGYQLVKKGRTGKKNRELYDIEINPEEAVSVQAMFDLADQYGYGGRRISSELKSMGIVNLRTGEPFHYSSIQNILRNPMYMGILRSGETKSEIFEELQIIEPEQFNRVKVGREQRSVEYEKKCLAAQGIEITEDGEEYHVPRIYPKRNGGKTLLSGNVYCGHCGGRILASTARRSHHPVASGPNRVSIYKCYNRTQHRKLCDGSTTYQAEKVDAVIDELLRTIFDRAKRINEREFLDKQIHTTTTQYQQQLKRAKAEYAKCTKELSKWEGIMLDSLEGNCVFTPEQVKKGMETAQEKSNSLLEQITTLQTQAEDAKATALEIEEQHHRLLSWADMYASASQDEKKIVASYIISEVKISRGYQLQVKFNISEAQYLSGMEMG